MGDALYADGKQVGVVTCGMYSTPDAQIHGARAAGPVAAQSTASLWRFAESA
jgi:hypothetical protein